MFPKQIRSTINIQPPFSKRLKRGLRFEKGLKKGVSTITGSTPFLFNLQ